MTSHGLPTSLSQLEKLLDTYFRQKAPKLPEDIQNIIVAFGPWLILIFILVSIPGILTAFGLGSLMGPVGFSVGANIGLMYTISWVFLAITLVLEALALPGLFNRQIKGWNFLFYASLVSLVQNIVLLNILGLIIGSGISFYILFQIRHHYK
ncbi:hypothetical protein A3C24_01020 [Candidatus Roizmanbacteria bacterium RIFCSPHIGHO2_02_FULL_37_24]|uniref:Chromate transporter n=1 Tax=Candidatus Roizmanbacteria bacterium RIFCSPHIGHO2_02_FULL_37_24 TaxID=1802037 RepID=A0A1F7GWG8_9BACT|nr:MAG: hypothetical protein A3C24_01020 [Candidatus Roizmanbacteria bacterium RIFCSPHIGHO2_02_FULL_37_24]